MQKPYKLLFLPLLFLSCNLWGQTALIPTASLCSQGQLQIASVSGTIGSYSLLTFICATVGPNVQVNSSTIPWTIVSVNPPGTTVANGPVMLHQIGDFLLTQTSPTTLVLGAGCSLTNPCNYGFEGLVSQIISPINITVNGGSGMMRVYIEPPQSILIAPDSANLLLTCDSNCLVDGPQTQFPPTAIVLHTWSVTNGTFDTAGWTDWRCFLCRDNFSFIDGMTEVQLPGAFQVSVP